MSSFSVRKLVVKTRSDIESELNQIGVDSAGVFFLAPKSEFYVLKANNIKAPAANILKQEMLSLGAECAIARGTVDCSVPFSDVILSGTQKHFALLIKKLKRQPFGLKILAKEIENLFHISDDDYEIQFSSGNRMNCSKRVKIMGIVNVTPDSFSDGGNYFEPNLAIRQGLKLAEESADILDIGGESTRPGAKTIDISEELDRVLPVIEVLSKELQIPISIDTRKSKVAQLAIAAGAQMINDVSAGLFDHKMLNVVEKTKVPIILMHHLGTPETMQNKPQYENIMIEVFRFFEDRIQSCEDIGISNGKILLDVGIGFGKRLQDNLKLIRNLSEFQSLKKPLVLGVSRKSFIGEVLNVKVNDRKEGSLAAAIVGMQNGANILRVHDVAETKKIAKMIEAIETME